MRDTFEVAEKLLGEGLPVKRHFRYLLVGAQRGRGGGAGQAARGRGAGGKPHRRPREPDDMPLPSFVNLAAFKPGFLRDLGL